MFKTVTVLIALLGSAVAIGIPIGPVTGAGCAAAFPNCAACSAGIRECVTCAADPDAFTTYKLTGGSCGTCVQGTPSPSNPLEVPANSTALPPNPKGRLLFPIAIKDGTESDTPVYAPPTVANRLAATVAYSVSVTNSVGTPSYTTAPFTAACTYYYVCSVGVALTAASATCA